MLNAAITKEQSKAKPEQAKAAERANRPDSEKELDDTLREMLRRHFEEGKEMNPKEFLDLMRKRRGEVPKPGEDPSVPGLGQLRDMLGYQLDGKVAEQLNRHFKELLDGHRPGSEKAALATFEVRDSGKAAGKLAFATAVRADGWLLTKASEVQKAGSLQCRINGQWLPAQVKRTWYEHDLALIKVGAKDLPVVQWATNAQPTVGSFITAVAPAGMEPVAIGVVSVAARTLQVKGRGFLGVGLDTDEKGLKVREVVKNGAAINAGVQKDDRILEVDGTKPDSAFTFTRMISDRKAGDKVKLKLQRGTEVIEKEIQLGDRSIAGAPMRPGFDRMSGMGSTISKRKDDFASVIQTDFPLEAEDCGGPVTDLDGNVVGIVIARSGRIETLVVPSAAIVQALAEADFSK